MTTPGVRRVLNVGGNSREIPLPPIYAGWEQVLLDIDPAGKPDIVGDARNLSSLPGASFDAVYCSHNLEHYYAHDAVKVVQGFLHVLKDEGFAHILVPDIGGLMQKAVQKGFDLGDVIFESPAGPITVRDMLYGYQTEIRRSGNDFYAHKNGFTPTSLVALLSECGFKHCYLGGSDYEIMAYALRQKPGAELRKLLRLERWDK